MTDQSREALWWTAEGNCVQCTLCPELCRLMPGERGRCHVRTNQDGKLVTLVYGKPCAVHVDPIEKKPVFHMYPGSKTYSIATTGCNLKCIFCQNWEISQIMPEDADSVTLMPPDVIRQALQSGCKSIAYTYSEPTVFFEYVLDTARLARENGLKNIMVSAGYINPGPLKELSPYLDVVKIDLKGFNESFYREAVGAELKHILRTLEQLAKLHIMTEVVNLVVPTLNDGPREIKAMCDWIKNHLGRNTPLFFSRFHPQYKLQHIPPTPLETLSRARGIAIEAGLHYVYTGNVPGDGGEATYCPTCTRPVIERYGFKVTANRLLSGGLCPFDRTPIAGIWD